MSTGGYNPYPPPWPPGGGPYPPPYAPPRPSLWQRLRSDDWPTLGELLRGRRQRVHGCVWALILLPCTWGMTLPLLAAYPLARSARRQARRAFPVHGRRFSDPDLVQAQRARAWAAAAISVLLLIAYGKPGDMAEAQEQYVIRLMATPWLLLLSAPLVVALIYRWASPAKRAAMRPRLRAAGRSALWYLGACSLIPLLAVLLAWGITRAETGTGAESALLGFLLTLVGYLAMAWIVLFVLFASGPVVRSGFSTSEVHAALPALLTGVLVWEFMIIGFVVSGPPPGPALVQVLALVGGPASVSALAWWEIHRLRTRHGVALRE
ncbi:hypothetical protein [Streptomyces sp. SID9727]|uniref:hypothetical protein n=1 Tax=Streptomyces sp. SID9727 TaxID=2706114 RepID=UPI001EF3CB3C|nr:hypothetical protein [Streptomyces sp. SID9727]